MTPCDRGHTTRLPGCPECWWISDHDPECTPAEPNTATCCRAPVVSAPEDEACDECGLMHEEGEPDCIPEPPEPAAGVNAMSVPPAKATTMGAPTPGAPAAAAGVGGDYLGVPAQHIEYLCRVMHDAYEGEAARVGWKTQPASQAWWEDVPESNKAAMRAGVRALVDRLFRPESDSSDCTPDRDACTDQTPCAPCPRGER